MEPVTKDEYDRHKEVCGRSFNAILVKLDSIDKRLFHDNGTLSVQTQIRLNSETIGTIKKLAWAFVIAAIGSLISIFMK